jgi:sRNA-binding protein
MARFRVDAKNIITTLAELFPKCFVENMCEPHRPLKLGTDRELVALGVLTEAEARAVFRCYVGRLMYQRALTAGGPRFGLDGQPCGEVTAEQMAGAKAAVAAIEVRRAEKAKAIADEKRAARITAKALSTPSVAPKQMRPPLAEPANPTKLSLADLKAARRARHEAVE